MLLGDVWRAMCAFFHDDYEEPVHCSGQWPAVSGQEKASNEPASLTTDHRPSSEGRSVQATTAEMDRIRLVPRTDVMLAISAAVLNMDSSPLYSPEQRHAVRVMAVDLETVLHLPSIHSAIE